MAGRHHPRAGAARECVAGGFPRSGSVYGFPQSDPSCRVRAVSGDRAVSLLSREIGATYQKAGL